MLGLENLTQSHSKHRGTADTQNIATRNCQMTIANILRSLTTKYEHKFLQGSWGRREWSFYAGEHISKLTRSVSEDFEKGCICSSSLTLRVSKSGF
jgi:hypothetical protein